MDISFCKLKSKEVVNICDGRNLGNITDMIMDSCTGKIIGITVPCDKRFFNIFRSNNEIFIPYNRICKIGQDIILVDIIMQNEIDCCNIENKYQNSNNSKSINIKSILNNINNINEK